jgi:hypothetical protein
MQLTQMKIGNAVADITKPVTINLQNFSWGPNEATKTINTLGVSYSFKASEQFNKMDVEDMIRNKVLPASSRFTDNTKWGPMMLRAGLAPWDNNVGDIQPMADRFVEAAFGPGKKLNIHMQTMSWTPSVGGISTRMRADFPRLSGMLPSKQYGIDFSGNNYGDKTNAAGSADMSAPAGGSTNPGSGSPSNSPASNLIKGLNTGIANATANINVPGYNFTSNEPDYMISYSVGFDSGVGVVDASNAIIKSVIQQKKDLGYPADIFMNLPGFGTAYDSMQSSMQIGTGTTISPGGGVNAPQIKIVAPPKLNQR